MFHSVLFFKKHIDYTVDRFIDHPTEQYAMQKQTQLSVSSSPESVAERPIVSPQIPLEQKALVDTAGQIFRKSGSYRDALLLFIEQNKDEDMKQSSYIDEQTQIVEDACRENVGKRVSRIVTHQRKVVQITVELQWTQDRSVSDSPWRLFWCVVGTDLQEIFRFLPKAINPDGSLSVPKRGTNHSRWYPLKGNYGIFKRIALELRMLQIYISSSEEIVKQREMVRGSADDVKDVVGILDLDVEVDTHILNDFDTHKKTHFVDLVGTFKKNRGNPHRLSHGTYLYNKNGTSTDVLNQLFETDISEIQKIPKIYNHHINILRDFSNTLDVKNHLSQMMKGDYLVGLMSVNRHTLFWVKHGNTWYLCDPWKKRFSPGYDAQRICENMFDDVIKQINLDQKEALGVTAHDTKWLFLARQYNEQYKTEGSCSLAALSRVVQFGIRVHAIKSEIIDEKTFTALINEPITDWAAMLASCMIRKVQLSVKRV